MLDYIYVFIIQISLEIATDVIEQLVNQSNIVNISHVQTTSDVYFLSSHIICLEDENSVFSNAVFTS